MVHNGSHEWVETHLAYIQDPEYKKYLDLLEYFKRDKMVFKGKIFEVSSTKVTMPVYGNVDVDLAALHVMRLNAQATGDMAQVAEIEGQIDAREMYKVRVNLLGLKPDPYVALQSSLQNLQRSDKGKHRDVEWKDFEARLRKASPEYVKYPITYYLIEKPKFTEGKGSKTKSRKHGEDDEPMSPKSDKTAKKSKTEDKAAKSPKSDKGKKRKPDAKDKVVKSPKSPKSPRASLPFKTRDECSSQARTKPYYMSKDDLIKAIKANETLKKRMPPGYDKLKKEGLCDAIFE